MVGGVLGYCFMVGCVWLLMIAVVVGRICGGLIGVYCLVFIIVVICVVS